MRGLLVCLSLMCSCLVCVGKEIVIEPQFAVGDTLRYRSTAQMIVIHGKDSLVTATKLLPTIVVQAKNEEGFVLRSTNSLEDYKLECTVPEAMESTMVPRQAEELEAFVQPINLMIQLGPDYHPALILNLAEVSEAMLGTYIQYFKKHAGEDFSDSKEWEIDTYSLIEGIVDMKCTTNHLIDELFGGIPYFNFIGMPLKSGKIPSTMVLTEEFRRLIPNLDEMKMDVRQLVNTTELNMAEEDGFYVIRVRGKKGKSSVEGQFLYASGIMENGFLSFRIDAEGERYIINSILEGLK